VVTKEKNILFNYSSCSNNLRSKEKKKKTTVIIHSHLLKKLLTHFLSKGTNKLQYKIIPKFFIGLKNSANKNQLNESQKVVLFFSLVTKSLGKSLFFFSFFSF
jgi:hypothetical protein